MNNMRHAGHKLNDELFTFPNFVFLSYFVCMSSAVYWKHLNWKRS